MGAKIAEAVTRGVVVLLVAGAAAFGGYQLALATLDCMPAPNAMPDGRRLALCVMP